MYILCSSTSSNISIFAHVLELSVHKNYNYVHNDLFHEHFIEILDGDFIPSQKNRDFKTLYFDQLDNAHDLQDIKLSIVNHLKIEFIQT